jgi:hypothetical protein
MRQLGVNYELGHCIYAQRCHSTNLIKLHRPVPTSNPGLQPRIPRSKEGTTEGCGTDAGSYISDDACAGPAGTADLEGRDPFGGGVLSVSALDAGGRTWPQHKQRVELGQGQRRLRVSASVQTKRFAREREVQRGSGSWRECVVDRGGPYTPDPKVSCAG